MQAAEDLVAEIPRPLQLVDEFRGGQGRTLRVRGVGGEELVVKVLPAGDHATEVALASSISHPAIPKVHEVGRLPDGRTFVLRDYVQGQPLSSLPRSVDTLRPVLQQLLEVIAFVHLRGVLHLDLKPSNLVVDDRGTLYLLDFGLAVRTGSQATGGTPFFAAPEVLFGAVPDGRADLFSIGAMVVHALLPDERLSIERAVKRFPMVGFLEACGVHGEELPHPFGAFVKGCVARRPVDRFPDADAALEALCGGGGGRPSSASLAPDPVAVFAPELCGCADAEHDVCILGSDAATRRAVALHLAVVVDGVRAVEEADERTLLRRDDRPGLTVRLPDLDDVKLRPHVQSVFGLEGDALRDATQWLLSFGRTTSAIHAKLRELVENGELLPSGTRWVWPAARSGRLQDTSDHPAGVREGSLVELVRRAAADGQFDRARALWRSVEEACELPVRTAMVEGLLDGGEPARALSLCADLPLLRAQALLDTGQYALAARELAELGEPREGRHRRVAAQLAVAGGDHERARQLLESEKATVSDRLVLAAVLERIGDLDGAERVLRCCLEELDEQRDPFRLASLHTTFGHVARQRQDLADARRHFEIAVRLAQRVGHLRHAATSQINLGVVAKDAGEFGEAASRFREANALYEHVGDEGLAAIAKANLGIAALARDDVATARTVLDDASRRLLALGDEATARLAFAMLARAHVRAGDTAAAETAIAAVGEPDTDRLRAELDQVQQELRRRGASSDDAQMIDGGESGGPSRELFRTFLAVNRKLAQAVELDEAMRALLDAAVTLTGGRSGFLLVMREDGMRREFQSGDQATHAQAFSRSLAHRAIDEQRTLTGVDVLADSELQMMQSVKNLRVRSAICTPFRSAQGTRGAIYVEHPGRAGVFSEHDKESLEVLADQAAIAVDRMLREEELREALSKSKRELVVARRSVRREAVRLVGESDAIRNLRSEIDKLANLDLSVLILGETGTGKELVARALHDRGARAHGPFIAENCSALPAELMERELFGHVEGAFTGADRDRPGLLELASGGTLFLDEVGDMPSALQVKLLRALQEQAIRRVGGSETIELDLRMVAATHKDLRAMIREGRFREDLYFRLAAVELSVPALRDRVGDVEILADHFLARHASDRGARLRLSKAARAALLDYRWPGNVRELDHVIARAALLCDGEEIVDLQLPDGGGGATEKVAEARSVGDVLALKEVERRAIVAALGRYRGDKAKAARALGISRTALYDKIKRHELGS